MEGKVGVKMNLVFCTSPFQVLVAREVARYTKQEFYGMYLMMSQDSRQMLYAEKMKEFCQEVCVLQEKNVLETVKNFLDGKKISSLYLASLDNPVALSFFNPNEMNLFTFDDGSTSIIIPNMYTKNLNRVVSPLGLALGQVMSLSQKHFTVFEQTKLFEEDKQISLQLNTQPLSFKRAENGKKVRVFLGQGLGSIYKEKEIQSTKQLTKRALQDCNADLYYPHPRVQVEVDGVRVAAPTQCFEEEIYSLLEEYENVEVYGFYSTAFLFVKDIEGVAVQSYRTLLSTHETETLEKYGVNSKNLSLSDTIVDIVMPVYNGEKTIEESIQSILHQIHQNFRLWIVDDGSTDKTQEVCQKYLTDSRIHFEKLNHQGISRTLIAGVNLAQGEIISRQDSDDVWMPWHLDLVLEQLESNPTLEIVAAKVTPEESEKDSQLHYNVNNHLFGEELWYQLAFRNLFNHSTVIFRKSAYEEAGGYQPDCDGFEDWHLWARMVSKENAYILNVVTAYYRLSERHKKGMAFRARLARTRGLTLEEALEGE